MLIYELYQYVVLMYRRVFRYHYSPISDRGGISFKVLEVKYGQAKYRVLTNRVTDAACPDHDRYLI